MNRRDIEEQHREVTEMLRSLPRVEAPANFEFGVKARIAAAGPDRRSASTMFPFLKVAVPLSLVLLLGGFVFFYGVLPGDSPAVADMPDHGQVAETIPAPRSAEDLIKDDVQSGVGEPRVEAKVDDKVEDAAPPALPRTRKTPSTPRPINIARRPDHGGGSLDTGLGSANLIEPPGINSNKNVEVSIREFLGMLGMKAERIKGKWTVRSISANSVAARSGVEANDVVESINDQSIGGATTFKGNADGKSITVGRGGKSIRVDLKF